MVITDWFLVWQSWATVVIAPILYLLAVFGFVFAIGVALSIAIPQVVISALNSRQAD